MARDHLAAHTSGEMAPSPILSIIVWRIAAEGSEALPKAAPTARMVTSSQVGPTPPEVSTRSYLAGGGEGQADGRHGGRMKRQSSLTRAAEAAWEGRTQASSQRRGVHLEHIRMSSSEISSRSSGTMAMRCSEMLASRRVRAA
eukprot:scaffold4937_cov30-Tisochrysis_lutea.AAC.4